MGLLDPEPKSQGPLAWLYLRRPHYKKDAEAGQHYMEDSYVYLDKRRKRGKQKILLALFGVLAFYIYVRTDVFTKISERKTCSRGFSRVQQQSAVRCHYKKARARGLHLQRAQSRTLEAAKAEYDRRYGRDPPRGFDQWFQYSKGIDAAIIDDYDQIEANLRPFRSLSAEEMYQALNRVTNRSDPLDTFSIRNGKVSFPGDPLRKHIRNMHAVLDPIATFLPDMDFVLNWGDREAVKGFDDPPTHGPEDPKKTDRKWHTDGWTFYTAACPNSYLSQNSFFLRSEIDLCANQQNSALVEARGDMQQAAAGISNLVPVFSWSKFSTSRDILVPHWALSDSVFRGWNSPADPIPFEDKKKDLYWRGSTTGPSVSVEKWRHNYRVRFVQYMQDLTNVLEKISTKKGDAQAIDPVFASTRLEDNESNRQMLHFGLSADNLNVKFTGLAQCGKDKTGCSSLANATGIVIGDQKMEEYHHQFLFDIDGNSMSGRFYRLLQTNGLVFKQTLLGEWHDDRLVPWFHYVPVNFASLGEIPQLLDFFLNSREGRRLANIIATEGQKAARSSLRLEDISQYWYRLLLEYSSLFEA